MKKIFSILLLLSFQLAIPQVKDGFMIARLKYNGGGDWYNDPSAEVNLLKYVAANTNIKQFRSINLLIYRVMKYFLIHLFL